MHKGSIVVFGILLTVLIVFFTWPKVSKEPQSMACTMEAKLCPDGSSVGRSVADCAFSECLSLPAYQWKLTESEAGASGMPYTTVGVVIAGKLHDLGTQTGSCREVKLEEKGVFGELADVGEISRVQCWFAGGGVELGIFKEGQQTMIKSGLLDEGTPESGPMRGNWKTLLVL